MLVSVLTICVPLKLAIRWLLTEKVRFISNTNNLVLPLVRSSVTIAIWCWTRIVSLNTCWKLTWLRTMFCMRTTRTRWHMWETLRLDANRNRQARTRLLSPKRSFARNIANLTRTKQRRALRLTFNFLSKSLKWSEVQYKRTEKHSENNKIRYLDQVQ